MPQKRIILHVGLHKTATTFLQERVFPALPEVRFVHPLHVQRPDDGPIERFIFEIFFRNGACIDIDAHREAIDAWLETVPEPTVLISSEAIVGWPIENHSNFRVNADLLAEMFPDAKIWLVVRRQDKWVEAAYAQVLRSGFSTTMARYLNHREGRFGRYNVGLYNGPNVDARDLSWERFDRYYRRRFGEQAVLTLPFELFAKDGEDFLGRFYDFAGLDGVFPDTSERVNVRWSPAGLGLAKLINRVPMPIKRAVRDRVGKDWHPSELMAKTVDRWLPSQGKRQYLSPALARDLMALHREGNRALGERIGVDLGEFGYG